MFDKYAAMAIHGNTIPMNSHPSPSGPASGFVQVAARQLACQAS